MNRAVLAFVLVLLAVCGVAWASDSGPPTGAVETASVEQLPAELLTAPAVRVAPAAIELASTLSFEQIGTTQAEPDTDTQAEPDTDDYPARVTMRDYDQGPVNDHRKAERTSDGFWRLE